jgi:DNA polymerase V
MTVVGLRTARELRGVSCLDLELVRPDRKTLIRSRSFGSRVTAKETLREALAKHAQRAAEKLREEGLVARGIQVLITTKRFGDPPHYENVAGAGLAEHTAHPEPFARASRRLLEAIYREGPAYKKAGVMLYDLRPSRPRQESLFGESPSGSTETDEALLEAVDAVNREMGRGTVGLAAAGLPGERDWSMQRTRRSPRYTTRWDELPVASAEAPSDKEAV